MHKLTLTLLAALASPLAFAQSAAFDYDSAKAPPTGTLLHYTKSNRDGSKPWHVEIYVQSPTRINVIKWVEGNTDFVEIMADIDTTLAMPIVLQQWNTAGGRREPRLSMRGLPGEGGPTLKAQLADGPSFDLRATTPAPFNFWGFDLAGLGFMLPHWSTPEQPLELWFADPNRANADGSPVLVERATLKPVGEETIDGVVSRKYALAGAFFGDRVGTVWVGRDSGRIERAEHAVRTSTDWDDWKLEFERAETIDGNAWEKHKLELADAQRMGKPAASAAGAMKRAYDQGGIDAAFAAAVDYRKSIDAALEGDFNTFGYALLGFGKTDDALRVFERVARDHPDSANAWDSLGEAQAAAGHTADAITSYRKSLKLDPKNTHAREQIEALSK
jgi:hypothetical protein